MSGAVLSPRFCPRPAFLLPEVCYALAVTRTFRR